MLGADGTTATLDHRMVGREPAQATLIAALDRAATGRAAAVAISGEAGAGKTMLVEWLVEEAAGRGSQPPPRARPPP